MSQKEIDEMVEILMEMGLDTYLKCKHMILSDAVLRSTPGTVKFFKDVFALTDKHRPLLLEMKGSAVNV